jgi:hypothetical protein
MKYLITLSLLILPFTSFAAEFCSRTQTDILNSLENPLNRIAFKNAGGIFNSGVCWWHSRLQRSATYLVRFAPEKAKPTATQVSSILFSLRNMNQVVTIPGFTDFKSFTKAYQVQTQKMLNDWQKFDGVINREWERGISGHSSLPSAALELQMHKVFDFFKNSPLPVWVLVQIKGISSHAYLILDMEQVSNGLDFHVIDSNHPEKKGLVQYRYGQTSLREVGEKYTFVPYVGFQNDFRLISASLKTHCHSFTLDRDFAHIEDGQIELPKKLKK